MASLLGFGIRVMVDSYNEFGSLPSSTIFWKSLSRIGVAAAAAAKSLQSCPTLCDPEMAAYQALLSLGFSRKEHRSGLPFPSPKHESEK